MVRGYKGVARIHLNSRWAKIPQVITSWMTITSTIPIRAPWPGRASPASMRHIWGVGNWMSLSDNKTDFGAEYCQKMIFIVSDYLYAFIIGQSEGRSWREPGLAGFASGGNGGPGIAVQAPQFEGVENIAFPFFVIGVPSPISRRSTITYYLSDGLSKVMARRPEGGRTIHIDQVNDDPNGTFNGTFNITGTETRDAYEY